MTKDEALKLALEALEPLVRRAAPWGELDWLNGCKAITAIKEALAQPEQEPVAKPKLIGWRTENFLWETADIKKAQNWEPNIGVLPIFEGDPNTQLTTPPQRKPLTDEERLAIRTKWMGGNWTCGDIIDAVEAAHGIKGEA